MGNIKNDSIQTQYYEGEEYILNDNGICNEDSCKCKGFHHKLKIFYQSFEFESPTQTKNLANFFNDILKDNNICAFESFTNGEKI